jgi:hypothetical protein
MHCPADSRTLDWTEPVCVCEALTAALADGENIARHTEALPIRRICNGGNGAGAHDRGHLRDRAIRDATGDGVSAVMPG